MDARALLRQYLEQRRDLGESEFVLDGLSVEEAMRLLGAPGEPPPSPPAPARSPSAPRRVREAPPESDTDWRAALLAAGASPPAPDKGSAVASRPKAPDAAGDDEVTPLAAAVEGPISIGTGAVEPVTGSIGAASTLDELAALIRGCQSCRLHAGARNAVPGEGNPAAEFVVVGEAPGAKEDETGRPFVGPSGELLTRILEAVQLPRDEVFICNVIKHRPPENRNPSPDEIAACRPFLRRQLELLRPKVILAVGTFAAQTLLESRLAIGKLRGHEHSYYGVPLVVTYHPAALLRNPAWKRPTWEDVQFARRLLDRARGDV